MIRHLHEYKNVFILEEREIQQLCLELVRETLE